MRQKGLRRRQKIRPKLFEQPLLSLIASALVEHHHAARSQDERDKLFRIPEPACPQSLENSNQHLLREIVRGLLVSQMAESVETDSLSHAPDKFGFHFAPAAGADAPYQFRVAEFEGIQFRSHPCILCVTAR